jgi:hypothetical protein
MGEPTEDDRQRQRAEELRAQIEDLRRGVRDPSQPESPREFTDKAASEAARGAEPDLPPDEEGPA